MQQQLAKLLQATTIITKKFSKVIITKQLNYKRELKLIQTTSNNYVSKLLTVIITIQKLLL